jgi:DNA/RNA-binding domain of Phe-tRNA-synthetase-like protein
MKFEVADEVIALGVPVVALQMSGIVNDSSPAGLDEWVEEAIRTASAGENGHAATLAGFKELHTAVGVRARPAPDALRRLAQKSRFPRINPLVDAYNALSLATGLALGAHDTAAIEGGVELRLSTGAERFLPLMAKEGVPVEPGQYVYVDGADDVLCWLEVRQGDKTKVTGKTTSCLFVIQGNPHTPSELLVDVQAELGQRISRFCGGEVEAATLWDADGSRAL